MAYVQNGMGGKLDHRKTLSGLEIWQLSYENKILLHCIYLWPFFFWSSALHFKYSNSYLLIFVLPRTVGTIVDTWR